MEEKKYLKGWQKAVYGLGDFGGNFCYTFVSSFVMLYLSNIVGLDTGIVGVLMLISKITDGISDVFFGSIMDRTQFKSGKAKPWLFMAILPLAVTVLLEFTIPNMESTLQYLYFFVVYTLMNSVFFTILNISYNTLTVLVTKNATERVQMGVWRYVFALAAAMGISIATPILVTSLGGDVNAWRTIALVYAVILTVACLPAVICVKELSPEELYDTKTNLQERPRFIDSLMTLFTNKYFLVLLGINIFVNMGNTIANTAGSYYTIYVLGNFNIYGMFSMAGMLPMIIGLFLTPVFVQKYGMYKTNVMSLLIAFMLGIPYILVGKLKMIPIMLGLLAIRGVFTSPIVGTLNALAAEASRNVFLKTKKRMEGSMFACTTMGVKVGSGVGTALAGWLLSIAHYDGAAQVQPQSATQMIEMMYIVLPVVAILVELLFVLGLKVEKENKELEAMANTVVTGK
jgi:GPH family glycoside/pentoside/hexuronide:cation symporter